MAEKKSDMKLGGGGRFEALKEKLASKPGVTDAGALAAYIGRKALGKSKFQSLAAKGRERAAHVDSDGDND